MSARTPRGLSPVEKLSLAYLLSPLPVFLVVWLQPLPSLLLLGLVGLSAWTVWRLGSAPAAGEWPPTGVWCFLTLVAAAWAAAGGLVGPLPLNHDWVVRMAVLRDLVVYDWPVVYEVANGGDLMLRFSMGYYLLAALVGKALGLEAARLALGMWTILGTTLFFALVTSSDGTPSWRRLGVLVLVLVFFSGLDVVGKGLSDIQFGAHIEWWASFAQYSSQTTLLFWVPNHAIPGWLIAALAWRHRNTGLDMASVALWLLAASWWSPLVAFGAAPILVVLSLQGVGMRAGLAATLHPGAWACVPPALVVAHFVTFDLPRAATDEAVRAMAGRDTTFLFMWLRFTLLEWGLLAIILAAPDGGRRALPLVFWVSAATLLALPFLLLPTVDVVMRGGIAPMTVVAIVAGLTLVDSQVAKRWRAAVALLLIAGMVTPVLEMQRGLLPGSQWPDGGKNLMQSAGKAWNYVGVLRLDSSARHWLRSSERPAPVRND